MTKKEIERIDKELKDKLMEMPELEQEEERSECCGAKYVGETDLCSKCGEHTGREQLLNN